MRRTLYLIWTNIALFAQPISPLNVCQQISWCLLSCCGDTNSGMGDRCRTNQRPVPGSRDNSRPMRGRFEWLGMGGRCRSCDRCGHMRSGGLGVSEEGVGLYYPGLVTMRHVGVVTCVTQPVTRHEAASHPIVSWHHSVTLRVTRITLPWQVMPSFHFMT